MVSRKIADVVSDATDSDLEGLLGGIRKTGSKDDSTLGGGSTTTSLNLDHLTHRKQKVGSPPNRKSGRKTSTGYRTNYHGRKMSFSEYFSSYLSIMCFYYPKSCGLLLSILLLTIMALLASLIWNPTEEFGHIHHDHSNIQSKYDLSMKEIDHWCLGGGDDQCGCEDPLVPLNRIEFRSWVEAFKANRRVLKRFQDPLDRSAVDVAFLGESIVEELDGRWMGQSARSTGLRSLERIFQSHFRKDAGASLEGVALGIAGDTAPNILWRLMHGEMPDYFSPKVWWLVLGSNDLGRMLCSEEIVILGILRVVEEILEKRPNAKVVINSIFPMTTIRGGLYPTISDFEDSFSPRPGGHRLLVASASASNLRPSSPPKVVSATKHRTLLFGGHKKEPVPQVLPPHKMTEKEMAEAAEKEEEARDKQARKDHSSWLPTRMVSNPIMQDKEKVRKYELGRHFVHKSAQPLWTSIKAINKELRKFAEKQDRVTFYDSTALFTEKVGKSYALLTDRISVRGHPTEQGFALWEDEIVEKLHKILNIMKEEQPDLFDSPKNESHTVVEKESDIIDDDAPVDDDLDDAILHANDDGMGIMAVDYDDDPAPATDESDSGGEGSSEDDGELYVAQPQNGEDR